MNLKFKSSVINVSITFAQFNVSLLNTSIKCILKIQILNSSVCQKNVMCQTVSMLNAVYLYNIRASTKKNSPTSKGQFRGHSNLSMEKRNPPFVFHITNNNKQVWQMFLFPHNIVMLWFSRCS